MVKIFIGGFPLEMRELELVQMVSPYAFVETIKIIRDKKTKICKGYAFLEIKTEEDAERAIDALNGTPMGERVLTLNLVEPKSEEPILVTNNSVKKVYVKTIASSTGQLKKKRPRL